LQKKEVFAFFFGDGFVGGISPSSQSCLVSFATISSAMAASACSKALALDKISGLVEEYLLIPVFKNSYCQWGKQILIKANFISSLGNIPV
jgi:hypothetical protein